MQCFYTTPVIWRELGAQQQLRSRALPTRAGPRAGSRCLRGLTRSGAKASLVWQGQNFALVQEDVERAVRDQA